MDKEGSSISPFCSLREVRRKRYLVSVHTRAGLLARRVTAAQISTYCHVSEATAYRWIKGTQSIPLHMLELLQIKALGLIPDPAFDGFRVSDGVLFTDTGASFPLEALNDFRRIYSENREHRIARFGPIRLEKDVSMRGQGEAAARSEAESPRAALLLKGGMS